MIVNNENATPRHEQGCRACGEALPPNQTRDVKDA
jgi:hypothetical protein